MKKKIFIVIIVISVSAFSAAFAQLYVGSYGGGIYVSRDEGESWSRFALHPYCTVKFKLIKAESKEILYCCTYDGLWKFRIDQPLKATLMTGPRVFFVNDITFDPAHENNLYIAAMNGVFKSTDSGNSWKTLAANSAVKYTTVLDFNNERLLAGKEDGLFISFDDGQTWEKTMLFNKPVRCLKKIPENLIIGTEDFGIFVSKDDGKSWQSSNTGLNHLSVYCLEYDPENKVIFAGTYGGGIYVSKDHGDTWKQLNNELSAEIILSIELVKNKLYASCFWKGLYRSIDNGASFKYLAFATKGNYGIAYIWAH